jgi:hypothetical protein
MIQNLLDRLVSEFEQYNILLVFVSATTRSYFDLSVEDNIPRFIAMHKLLCGSK